MPVYIINIIRDYLNNRRLPTEMGDLRISCGVPQGSVIGPLFGNIFYNDLLNRVLPARVNLTGFADDLAVVRTAHTTDLLEETVNPALSLIWVAQTGKKKIAGV